MKKQYLALSLLTPVLCSALTVEARTPKENKVTNREQPNAVSYTHLDVYKRQD